MFCQPFATFTTPGCPSRAALPISYQPTTKVASGNGDSEELEDKAGNRKNPVNSSASVTPSHFILHLLNSIFIQGANLPLLLRTTISPFALISLFFGTLHRFFHVRFHGVFHASVNAFEIFITVPP
jgi:hypothetical protein